MKLKPKGRKIYRYKTRFERLKGFFRNSGAIIMTIAGTAVLVFVGYSVGGPVMRFLEEQNVIAPAGDSVAETMPTAESTEPSVQQTEASVSDTTAPSETLPQETDLPESLRMQGCVLAPDALSTAQNLRDALSALPAGTTHVFVPLKTAGGSLHYASAVEDSGMSGAVVAAMPLMEIHTIISEAGFVPAAVVNALDDSVYPQTFADAAYTLAGSSERWLDASPENGGKPLLSPFSPLTKEYLSELAAEISGAGFQLILCEGLDFPDFSEDDLALLDPRAGSPDRGAALVHLVSAMQEAAGDAVFCIAVDGTELLSGKPDILSSGAPLTADAAAVAIPAGGDFPLAEMQAKLGDIPCIPMFTDNAAAGASSYILRQKTEIPKTTEPTEITEQTETTEPTETTEQTTASELVSE